MHDQELDAVAEALHNKLAPTVPSLVTIGVGKGEDGKPLIYVYVKKNARIPEGTIPKIFRKIAVQVTPISRPSPAHL